MNWCHRMWQVPQPEDGEGTAGGGGIEGSFVGREQVSPELLGGRAGSSSIPGSSERGSGTRRGSVTSGKLPDSLGCLLSLDWG